MEQKSCSALFFFVYTFTICFFFSGAILSFYTLLLSGGSLFLTNGIDSYVSAIQSLDLSRPMIFLIKFLIGLPFSYHYFIGIRFAMWNAGKWLELKDAYASAKKAIVLGGVVAFLFAML